MKSCSTSELISQAIRFKNNVFVELSMVMVGSLRDAVIPFEEKETSLKKRVGLRLMRIPAAISSFTFRN